MKLSQKWEQTCTSTGEQVAFIRLKQTGFFFGESLGKHEAQCGVNLCASLDFMTILMILLTLFLLTVLVKGGPHGRETVQLRHMWEMFQQHGQPEQTPAYPHRGEAVQLRHVWTQLQPGQQPESPPADTHRGETVHVRQVWEEFLLSEELEGPQVFLHLKLSCNVTPSLVAEWMESASLNLHRSEMSGWIRRKSLQGKWFW